jgi:signal transduction histidine kinase
MGTRSMRERAAELGGLVELEAPPEGGTRVRARLPLAVPAPAGPPAAGAADAADAAERLEVPA